VERGLAIDIELAAREFLEEMVGVIPLAALKRVL